MQPGVGCLDRIGPDGRVLARRTLLSTNTREAPHLTMTPGGQLVLADAGGERIGQLAPDLTWVATLADKSSVTLPVAVTTTRVGEVWLADAGRNAAVLVSPASAAGAMASAALGR